MLVSTFELLLGKITPSAGKIPGSDRQVLQGYFLTVANTTDTNLRLRLEFTATTPTINLVDTFVVTDVSGTNLPQPGTGDLRRTSDPKKYFFDLAVGACDTGLFILQPDITRLDPKDPNFKKVEVRGFVEISLLSSIVGSFDLLLTPEHRGTFLPNANRSDFDQLVYALPTPTGGSLFTLQGNLKLKDVVDKPFEKVPDKVFDNKIFEVPKVVETGQTQSLDPGSNRLGEIQEKLGLMAQSIDSLQNQIILRQPFITAEERPPVGDDIVEKE